MNFVGLYIALCVKVFLVVKAQVTFSPDPAEDVQLQVTPLTPPVDITTVQCYSSAPNFKVQYARVGDNESVYDIVESAVDNGTINSCAAGYKQFKLQLSQIRFLANPALVGGTFRLKVILDNNDQHSTLSRRKFTFVAPFHLTGSSVSAVRNFDFTWTCHVTSGYPVIEWFRNTTNVGLVGFVNGSCEANSLNNDSYMYECQQTDTSYKLTIPGSSLTEALQGTTWRCKEAEGATSELKGSRFLELDVVYPPTVTLYLQNTTESTTDHIIRCTTVGKPNNSTIVALEQRIGSTLIRNITKFTNSYSGNITLNIPRVSFQDMGTYTCLASNGIPDRNNQKIQSDTAYLNVITSAKFEMIEYTVRSDIDTQTVVRVPFYINPQAIESDLVWTNITGTSNDILVTSTNFSFSLRDADVQQMLHGVNVTLKGQSAILTIRSFKSYYEGNYLLKIKSVPMNSTEVKIVLRRSGPPDTPTNFSLSTRKVNSIVLTWNKGSNGGHPQTFVILYREKTSEIYRFKQLQNTTTNLNELREINGLKPDTSYVFLLYSFNEKGNSTGHRLLEERTLKGPVESSPSLNAGLVGGAAGGGTALLVTIVILVVVLKRRRTKGQGTESNSKKTGQKRQNNDDEDGDGLKDNPMCGSNPGGSNAVQGVSAGPENQSPYAEVVKPKMKGPAKTSEEPPHIYAEVDKPQKTNGKGKQKKQKAKVKAEGGKYPNVDGLKKNCSTDDQKAKENEQRGYRNKDGLFYMDVKFDQQHTHGKPTIRKEEPTGYAMIQFEEPNAKPTSNNERGAEGGR